MTSDEQLAEWVKGINIHNHDRDECCPDFSCCQSHYKASEQERLLFVNRPDLRDQLLMGFLGGALGNMGDKVHIAGSSEGTA